MCSVSYTHRQILNAKYTLLRHTAIRTLQEHFLELCDQRHVPQPKEFDFEVRFKAMDLACQNPDHSCLS